MYTEHGGKCNMCKSRFMECLDYEMYTVERIRLTDTGKYQIGLE